MRTVTTRTIEAPGAVLTYDVHEPASDEDHPPLFVLGSPMAASGFEQLVAELPERRVITYDPRGAERSTMPSGAALTGEDHGEDMHRVVAATGLGPVDVFATSGGAQFGLHWVATHPEDLRSFVAHEPPLTTLLPDRAMAVRVTEDILATYEVEGFGPAMAKFVAMVVYVGPLLEDYLDRPAPDPAMFGFPSADDGSRDDPLLGRNLAAPPFDPDLDAIRASGVRVVPAVGAAGEGTLAWRGGARLAEELGLTPVTLPGDHAGFARQPWAPDNDPAAFAARLREVLDVGPVTGPSH